MTISTIIATCNRSDLLNEALDHLARQRFAPGDEVIVVDNASTDGTASVIDRHERTFPVPLRHLHEGRQGKSHALAAALGLATGQILAFTDDDVHVDPLWLQAIRDAMSVKGNSLALVGGPVLPRWERPVPSWLRLERETYGRLAAPLALLHYGAEPAALGSRTLLGANLAVRREAMTAVGGFALHLGKVQGTLLSGEDHDLCMRVQAAGFHAEYDPRPVVRHRVPAERMRFRYFLEWFYWSGITNAVLDEGGPPVRSFFGVPVYLIRRSLTNAVATLLYAAGGRTDRAVECSIECAFAAGYAAHRLGLVALERQPAPAAGEAV